MSESWLQANGLWDVRPGLRVFGQVAIAPWKPQSPISELILIR